MRIEIRVYRHLQKHAPEALKSIIAAMDGAKQAEEPVIVPAKKKIGRPLGAKTPKTNAERQAAHRAKKRALQAP